LKNAVTVLLVMTEVTRMTQDDGFRLSLYFRLEDRRLHDWATAVARKRRQSLSAFIVESLERRLEAEFSDLRPEAPRKGRRS